MNADGCTRERALHHPGLLFFQQIQESAKMGNKQLGFSLYTHFCVSVVLNRMPLWVTDFVLKNAYYQEQKEVSSAIRK